MIADPPALAELKTPEGAVLIQERRRRPRAPNAPSPSPSVARGASSTPAMTALGGIIILLVLVGTYTTRYEAALGHRVSLAAVPPVGYLALQLFLARSAYRLFYDVKATPSVGDYVVQRLYRYLPATIPAVLLGYVLARLGGLSCFHAAGTSVPANLLMLADMIGAAEIDPSHWRLKIEILLSVFIGVAWFAGIARALPAALLLLLGIDALFVHGEPVHEGVLSLRGALTIDGYLPLIAFGIALHHLVQSARAPQWWGVLVAGAVLVVLSNTLVHGLVVLGSLALLAGVATHRLDMLGRARVLVRLGEFAFPIFVVHYVLGFHIIHALETFGLHPLPAMLVAGAAAIGAGKAVQVVFERPADRHGPAATAWLRRKMAERLSLGGLPQSA